MFAQLNVYKNLITGGIIIALLLGLYFYVHTLKTQITTLQSNLKDSYIEVANYKLGNERLKNSLTMQNKEVEKAKVNVSIANNKLAKWKALPTKVKYKTITKIREVKSNDCKDIKNTIDSIRNLDFNKL
ncbi:MAG: hypothetical protein QM497_04975 [Sulfurimonas sp.]